MKAGDVADEREFVGRVLPSGGGVCRRGFPRLHQGGGAQAGMASTEGLLRHALASSDHDQAAGPRVDRVANRQSKARLALSALLVQRALPHLPKLPRSQLAPYRV